MVPAKETSLNAANASAIGLDCPEDLPGGSFVWFHRNMLRHKWTLAIILASAIPVTGAALSQKPKTPFRD